MKKLLAILLTALFVLSGLALAESSGASAASGTLVIYSPHDASPLEAGVKLFEAAYPGIEVQVVAAGTGELLQRIAAESENPLADVLWGGGADSLAAFKSYFDPYVCANDAVIDEAYKDKDDLWIGESPLPMVIFYNRELVKDEEAPKTWNDLLDPKWKGQIAYASPAKSGSAFTQLCTMIFANGGPEGGGWDFVKAFYANLDGKVQDSSGNCHKLVKTGEYKIGITIEKSAVLYDGDDTVCYNYPAGNSAVPDGVAMVKNCPNPDNAKLFIDFVTGVECQTEQSTNWKRRPVRTDMDTGSLPALSELDLADYDFDWAANNKPEIIETWQDIMVG